MVVPIARAGYVNLYGRDVTERRRAEDALAFMSEASGALAESLDYEETLARIAWLAVPPLADWCIVSILEPGGSLRHAAVAFADQANQALAHELNHASGHVAIKESAAEHALREPRGPRPVLRADVRAPPARGLHGHAIARREGDRREESREEGHGVLAVAARGCMNLTCSKTNSEITCSGRSMASRPKPSRSG